MVPEFWAGPLNVRVWRTAHTLNVKYWKLAVWAPFEVKIVSLYPLVNIIRNNTISKQVCAVRVDPGKYGRNLHIEFSRTIVLSVPALQHRVPVFRFTLCLL